MRSRNSPRQLITWATCSLPSPASNHFFFTGNSAWTSVTKSDLMRNNATHCWPYSLLASLPMCVSICVCVVGSVWVCVCGGGGGGRCAMYMKVVWNLAVSACGGDLYPQSACECGLCLGGWFVPVYRGGLYLCVEVVCTCVRRWFVPLCGSGLYLCVDVVCARVGGLYLCLKSGLYLSVEVVCTCVEVVCTCVEVVYTYV